MTWDIITSLTLIFSIFIVWIQRKSIFELERDLWEIEQSYKKEVGKTYQYKHRTFQLWGTMKETKRGKNKMMVVTLIGLGLIAVGVKAVRLIQEKLEKKKEDNHEDCCG